MHDFALVSWFSQPDTVIWTQKIIVAIWETIYMTLVSGILAYAIGLPLGIILVTTARGHINENLPLNRSLGAVINALRSLPFIILMIFIIPFTRLLVGTSIGTTATIVPLTVAAVPFVARLVETSLNEIAWGLIEAALAMGASKMQVITRVLIPEAMPSLLRGVAITTINLIGYSAMAGIVGGGGLGTLAYYYGYQRYMFAILLITVVLLILLVQGLQAIGDTVAEKATKNRR
ncbi:MAG: methionine ABC transporter permease [Methylocystaceae bacterium]